jgi:hypothetical protein
VAAFRVFTPTYLFAGGVYVFVGAASHLVAVVLFPEGASPGLLAMIGVSALAG